MSSIISFGNVRMSGMGKNLVTSYAALGVGLALVLTFGLTAISSFNTQVYDSADRAVFTVTDPDAMKRVPAGPEQEMENKAMEAPGAAPPSEPSESQKDAGPAFEATPAPSASEPAPPAATGGTTSGEVTGERAEAPQEESDRESYSITTEVPASSNPFMGILVALPYIAAAAVGSAVFAVTRKRVGW